MKLNKADYLYWVERIKAAPFNSYIKEHERAARSHIEGADEVQRFDAKAAELLRNVGKSCEDFAAAMTTLRDYLKSRTENV